MISISKLTYRYPGADEPALTDLNLEVPAGQIVGLLGANGSGKSTLCHVLNGTIPQFYHGEFEGSATAAGMDVVTTPLAILSGEVGLVFDDPFNQLSGARYTVREEVAFGLENLSVPRPEMLERIESSLALTGLSELADRSPFALSGGQQQRLAIASILAMRPQVMVLDEPTSHLDPIGARQVLDAIAALVRQGLTTLVIADQHVEWLAESADRILVMEHGLLAADGKPRRVLSQAADGRWGIELTRYTEAAQAAMQRRLLDRPGELPITLQQAMNFFS